MARRRAPGALQYIGRWKNAYSMNVYVQLAMAEFILLHIPEDLHLMLRNLVSANRVLLAHPPKVPWTAFLSRRRQMRGWRAALAARWVDEPQWSVENAGQWSAFVPHALHPWLIMARYPPAPAAPA